MIRITVEIIPFGDLDFKRKIATAAIVNDLTGTEELGNYKYNITLDRDIISGEIKGHNRKDNVWKLIYLMLKNVLENEF